MVIARAVKDVFIVAAKRTPFGTYGGKLTNYTATDLQEVAARAALAAGKVNPEAVSSIIIGNVFHKTVRGLASLAIATSAPFNSQSQTADIAIAFVSGARLVPAQDSDLSRQASKDGAYMPRHVGLRIGVPVATPALAVNRLCGSGFQSVVSAAQDIMLGDSDIVLTGGAENMSNAPYALYNSRFGIKLGTDPILVDSLWQGLIDQQIKTPMGVTAENLAKKYEITRQQCDEFAVQSAQRWKAANDAGYFKEEMAPVTIKSKKGDKVMDTDEHPRPQTTVNDLAKLPSIFAKEGTVNAGNASGICDGAGCVILASESAVKQHNLTPLVRVAGYGISGCDPSIMGIGPVPAIEGLLKATGQQIKNIDIFDVNEAFAPQFLAVQKALGLPPEKTNVSGGAIALGHPVGASGSRITANLTHELRRQGGKYAVGGACIGGGQGIAVLLENMA